MRSIGSDSMVARLPRAMSSAQTLAFVSLDMAVVVLATLAAYVIRFEAAIPAGYVAAVPRVMAAACLIYLTLFSSLRLYSFVWRYAGVDLMLRVAFCSLFGGALLTGLSYGSAAFAGASDVPMTVPATIAVLTFLGASSWRAAGRVRMYVGSRSSSGATRVVIAGAGDAGSLLLRDIESHPELGLRVTAFLDDDPAKLGRQIRDVRVAGTIEDLPRIAAQERIDEVLVALPGASIEQRRQVLNCCNAAGVKTRVITGLAARHCSVGLSDLRKVSVDDLLGREPVSVDVPAISATIRGRVIAVTGAAGSIGSELCRQIMSMRPASLHLLEIDETRLFELNLELRGLDDRIPRMHMCDIRDEHKLANTMLSIRPDVVFHAAAYKHVPMMELAPDEAVKTNVAGTRAVIDACLAASVGHFVLISSDKAVAPANVMGATKAVAEQLTLAASARGLRTTAVRFGNVLGSRGSVVPLFEEQLRHGGPVTVTHPEATRYFMTIPEAASLVLQAQAMSSGNQIFVLDMGEPVRIVDLALKMISLSGVDASIEFTGLRPGEKTHEALVHDGALLIPTRCAKVLRIDPLPHVDHDLAAGVDSLVGLARRGRCIEMLELLACLLPEYRQDDSEPTGVGCREVLRDPEGQELVSRLVPFRTARPAPERVASPPDADEWPSVLA